MLERKHHSEGDNLPFGLKRSPAGSMKKRSSILAQPAREKMDSGVSGLDDSMKSLKDKKSDPLKRLPDPQAQDVASETVPADASGSDSKVVEPEDDDVETEEEVLGGGDADAGDSTENEGDSIRKDSNIDDDVEEEDENSTTPPSSQNSFSLSSSAPSSILKSTITSSEQPLPPATPTIDHSATFPRPHLNSPTMSRQMVNLTLGQTGKQKNIHIDDISKLDITVSPPTPGFHDSSSSSGIMDYSPVSSPRHSLVSNPITIKRGKKGYGLTFISIRVYIGDTNDYRIHHIIEVRAIARLRHYLSSIFQLAIPHVLISDL